MKIGFIGAGKVGFSLGKYLTEFRKKDTSGSCCMPFGVSGYYSQNRNSAREAAVFTGTKAYEKMEHLVEESELIFLTVPDGAIADVAKELSSEKIDGKCICHCSGIESSAVLQILKDRGAYVYSVHPFCAVSSKEFGYIDLKEACFTVEGDQKYLDTLHKLFCALGNPTEIISPDRKVQYHLAAVFASNLVVGLYQEAVTLLKECGLSEEFSQKALVPLFLNNAASVAKNGAVQALTGPVERADETTVAKHLQAASGSTEKIYRLLSQRLLEIAEKKHPDREYTAVKELLEEQTYVDDRSSIFNRNC